LLVHGPVGAPNWDSAWRAQLVENLGTLAGQLWKVGIQNIFVDGSFVEAKDHPNDIDGYFECDRLELFSGRLASALKALDPVWTWDPASRTPHAGSTKGQLPMWHRYRVELFPHYGQSSRIRDEHGHELEFPSAFRRSRLHQPRGIIKLLRQP